MRFICFVKLILYNQTGCYGLYRNGKIYIENIEYPSKEEHFSRGIRHYQTSVGTILNQNCTENLEVRVESPQCGLLEQLVTLDDLICCSEAG